MTQQEQDREDILREATALTVRAELTVAGFPENIVIGFRPGGAASVFVGVDPVFQFNSAGELRRGFRDGKLLKAVNGRLSTMRRERREGQVQLLRSELSDGEAVAFLAEIRDCLHVLSLRLNAGEFQIVGQVPSDEDVLGRIVAWLESLPREIAIAAKPNVA